jgi:signal transduction histidine kinase
LLVRAVSGALDQIVDNYLANALEHAHEVTRIDMQVRRFGQEVEVAVIDDGPGLSAEERDRAFDRFWRGANSAAGGSGVGLAVVRRLAHASNGTVRLAAREPHGLIAKVRLRAADRERGDLIRGPAVSTIT